MRDITIHPKKSIFSASKSIKNKFGQYFTPKIVADFMINLANISEESKILEPACGKGIFLDLFLSKGYKNLEAYEIDKSLATNYNFVKHQSFVSAKITEQFDLIIGNPPYIRWKNLENELKNELFQNQLWNTYCNSLCDYLSIFILKSIELLKPNGQLIFICPEYWMNTTHALKLRNFMVSKGYFESIFHFNETPIFENANVSLVIFKFIKSKNKNPKISITKYYQNRILTSEILNQFVKNNISSPSIERFEIEQFKINERWFLNKSSELESVQAFEKSCKIKNQFLDLFGNKNTESYNKIGDVCEIGNGMVSGLDKAFQLNGQSLSNREKANSIKVIKAKNLKPFTYNEITNYIFSNEIKSEIELKNEFPNFYKKLNPEKEKLNNRYNYNKKIQYWQWVFLRNYNLFSQDKPRIFVPCKERISNKNYFRFAFVEAEIYPTQDVTALFLKENTKEDIYYILAFLNNKRVFKWLKNKGIVKGNIVEFSEKPISSIPFRKINWENKKEIQLHSEIVLNCKAYIESANENLLNELNILFDKLLN